MEGEGRRQAVGIREMYARKRLGRCIYWVCVVTSRNTSVNKVSLKRSFSWKEGHLFPDKDTICSVQLVKSSAHTQDGPVCNVLVAVGTVIIVQLAV